MGYITRKRNTLERIRKPVNETKTINTATAFLDGFKKTVTDEVEVTSCNKFRSPMVFGENVTTSSV